MLDPVLASDGHTYERSCISEHIRFQLNQHRMPKSPLSNEILRVEELPRNLALCGLMDEFVFGRIDKSKGARTEKMLQKEVDKSYALRMVSKAMGELSF